MGTYLSECEHCHPTPPQEAIKNGLIGKYEGEVDYCNEKEHTNNGFLFKCTPKCKHATTPPHEKCKHGNPTEACLSCYQEYIKNSPTPSDSWEEELEKFVFTRNDEDRYMGVDVDADEVKALIRKVEERAKEETVREMWRLIQNTDGSRGYRSVAIIDAVRDYAKSKGIKID
jgi:hypothetical protein